MSAAIFNGSAVKILKDVLKFKSGQRIFTNDSANPSASARDGVAGDLYIRQGSGEIYIKKDSGVTINWDLIIDDTNLTSQLANYILLTEKGAALGVATLDAGGKVPASQLPNSVMDYKGTWAASTNTPTLVNGTGNAGDVYVSSDSGTVNFGAGNITFAAGDWVIYSGTVWEKSINSNAVASVNGFTGVVVLDTDDIAEGITNLYFTDERAQDAVGTILTDTSSIDFTYNDGAPSISAAVLPAGVDKNALGGTALTITNGGTGQTSANAALNALLPTQTGNADKALVTDGSNTSWVDVPISTPWVAYTPVFTGFGTATDINIWSRREGPDLLIRGHFSAGTTTATTAKVELGFNGTSGNVTMDLAVLPSSAFNTLVGDVTTSSNLAGRWTVLANAAFDDSLLFGISTAGTDAYNYRDGSFAFASTVNVILNARVPIDGWG